jgi:hypothetical protein
MAKEQAMVEDTQHVLPEDQVLTGERAYEQALDLVIASAERELLIFDEDLSQGAYASLERYELIREFLAKNRHNRLVFVLQDTHFFTTRCPRLYELLSVYGHAMTVYETDEQAKAARDCFVLADQKHYLRRFHIDHARFRYAFNDENTANMLNLRFAELLEASSRTISASRLGL